MPPPLVIMFGDSIRGFARPLRLAGFSYYRRSRYTDEPNSRNVIKSVRFLGHASSPRDRAGPIMLGDLPRATGLILGGT